MQPHTPENLALLFLDETSVYAGTFSQGIRAGHKQKLDRWFLMSSGKKPGQAP